MIILVAETWPQGGAAGDQEAAPSTCSAPYCMRPPTASPMPARSATPAAKAATTTAATPPSPANSAWTWPTSSRSAGPPPASPKPTAARYAKTLTELTEALVLWRRAEQASPAGPGRSRNALACTCACGRRIRVARSVLELAPILCGGCAQPFAPEDDAER
jgi:hypothetical protein